MSNTTVTEVAIVGGGVAGSSLGAALAHAGLAVTIIERESVFRDRVRGEAIMPWGVAEAERLGVLQAILDAEARPVSYLHIHAGRTLARSIDLTTATAGNHPGLDIYHPDLQDALLEHACRTGVTVLRPAKAARYRASASPEIDVETEDGEVTIRARLVVGADGRTSVARRWAGVETMRDPAWYQIGGGLVEGAGLATDGFHTSVVDDWMMLYFPHAGERGRLYIACHDELARLLRGVGNRDHFVPTIARSVGDGVMDDWTLTGPVAFFPNADIWASRAAGNGVALIGDAAGANDPIIGQGLSLALRDARELRDALLSGDWPSAIEGYADRRDRYYQVLRTYAAWQAQLAVGRGPEADAIREQVAAARKVDPSAGGLLGIAHRGPDGITLGEAERRTYFGVDIGVATATSHAGRLASSTASSSRS
ncbi:MAG TPA: NAD(P)/FAD-dependent oxidoreductase [Thermomicrobiales bacterium]|nr:NAD(P)/FAD-dependent oxidoreductase [Thermomicrobiales bacterium]